MPTRPPLAVRGPEGAPPMMGRSPISGDRWARIPGGVDGYRRPTYGDALPNYWASPGYYIPNYDMYGLARPSQGFGWSRYYDDAVLTDAWGRVYDWRDDIDWGRDGYWAREYGEGWDGHGGGYREGADGGWQDGRPPKGKRKKAKGGDYSYEGRWTGRWDGGLVRTYDGRFDGTVTPHWANGGPRDDRGPGRGPHGYRANYGGYGYQGTYYGPVTVIVQPGAPIITKTVSYVAEYVSVPLKRATRAWRPKTRAKPKPQCFCK